MKHSTLNIQHSRNTSTSECRAKAAKDAKGGMGPQSRNFDPMYNPVKRAMKDALKESAVNVEILT